MCKEILTGTRGRRVVEGVNRKKPGMLIASSGLVLRLVLRLITLFGVKQERDDGSGSGCGKQCTNICENLTSNFRILAPTLR